MSVFLTGRPTPPRASPPPPSPAFSSSLTPFPTAVSLSFFSNRRRRRRLSALFRHFKTLFSCHHQHHHRSRSLSLEAGSSAAAAAAATASGVQVIPFAICLLNNVPMQCHSILTKCWSLGWGWNELMGDSFIKDAWLVGWERASLRRGRLLRFFLKWTEPAAAAAANWLWLSPSSHPVGI